MAKSTKRSAKQPKQAAPYKHKEKALLRPEVGSQGAFVPNKPPGRYRYDSSLAPELQWDESAERQEGEKLLDQISNAETLGVAKKAAQKLKRIVKPFLNWTGKAERAAFEVPTLPLFVHERLSTQAVLDTLHRRKRDRSQTLDLFGEGDKSIGDAIRGAYQHKNGWQNRMILGDSLLVMNSLLEYENMGGQVQMAYMDPPYGIKFGSNFQPYIRKRNVEDNADSDMVREPEMVQAYRDTWTLGIHSWLTYMRDRLLLARELLTDSGSCFVQISDENVHLVRSVMDEVFGRENFVSIISFRTHSPLGVKYLPNSYDYIIWYGKDLHKMKFHMIYVPKQYGSDTPFNFIETHEGERVRINKESNISEHLKNGARMFRLSTMSSSGYTPSCTFEFEYKGENYRLAQGKSWRTSKKGMDVLASKKRLYPTGSYLNFIQYHDDFPIMPINNNWGDVYTELSKQYVVQTSGEVIQRCILMTTDPGDLVLDPTCGSGTTAYVAEQWGRRWITTDVSRVPLSLARQRLLTADFPYYQLKGESPSDGFVYKRKQNKKGEEIGGIVPHITLKSIANDEPPAEEVLVDKPEKTSNTVRVTGPFCVEAIMPPPMDLQDDESEAAAENAQTHNERMIEIMRLSPEIRLPGNKKLKLQGIRPPAKTINLHTEAMTEEDKTVAIVFGPENGEIVESVIVDAATEAKAKSYSLLLVVAFAIGAKTRKTVEDSEDLLGIKALYVQASTDLVMSDLLKTMRTSQVFAVCGAPDARLKKSKVKHDDGSDLYEVKLQGLDVYDPADEETHGLTGKDVPCWMLDPDYDGQCFRAGQVFFPRTSAWESIKKALRAEFDDSVWGRLAGDASEPFIIGENNRVAVKVIDDRGNELMVVIDKEEAE